MVCQVSDHQALSATFQPCSTRSLSLGALDGLCDVLSRAKQGVMRLLKVVASVVGLRHRGGVMRQRRGLTLAARVRMATCRSRLGSWKNAWIRRAARRYWCWWSLGGVSWSALATALSQWKGRIHSLGQRDKSVGELANGIMSFAWPGWVSDLWHYALDGRSTLASTLLPSGTRL